MTEVTDVQTKAERLQRETLIVTALEAIPGFAVLLNTERQIVCANSRFLLTFGETTGSRPGEACGCPFSVRAGCGSHPECAKCVLFQGVRSALDGVNLEAEGDWTTTLGHRFVEVLSTPITLFDERFAVLSVRDITRRVELERFREQAQQRAFESAHLASLATLAAGLAHEINNPLAIIVGNISLLKALPGFSDAEGAKRRAELVLSAAERIAEIVRHIRAFSDESRPKAAQFDASNLVQRTVEYFVRALGEGGISVETLNIEKGLQLYGDPLDLQRALIQIVANARDALLDKNDGERKLSVAVCRVESNIQIVVEDTGIGMSPHTRARALDPFFTTKPPGKGTGVGLTIAHRAVENLLGTLTLESEPGKGTRVTLSFPQTEIGPRL